MVHLTLARTRPDQRRPSETDRAPEQPPQRTDLEKPRRILLIRPSALGDVCRTVPVLASLRAAFPDSEIDWLVQDGFAPAIAAHPALTNVIPFPRKQVAIPRLWRPGAAATLFRLIRSLRDAHYDLVLDCQGLGRSGLFAWLTRAPRRVGFSNARELGWIGSNERINVPENLHTVDRMLALIEGAGVPAVHGMRLYTTEDDQFTARTLVPFTRYAVIAPTSRWPGKRWPIDRFTALTHELLALTAIESIAIVGGPDERDQCTPLLELARANSRVIDLVGKTPIGVLLAVIERAALVIANDSAPVHMAVGFDRPLVALFGPTRTDLVGPYRREQDVIRATTHIDRNLHKDAAIGAAAMSTIQTQTVIDAALKRLI